MQVQNLRVYERRGLLAPDRTAGGTRLYSHDDVDRLHRIRDLLAEGLNLAGIARVLELEDETPTPPPVRGSAAGTSLIRKSMAALRDAGLADPNLGTRRCRRLAAV